MTCPANGECPMCQPKNHLCEGGGCEIILKDGSITYPNQKPEPWYLRIGRSILAVLILVTAVPVLWVLAKLYEYKEAHK